MMGGMFAGHDQSGEIATDSYYGHLLCVFSSENVVTIINRGYCRLCLIPREGTLE